jgi:hypothetical protein
MRVNILYVTVLTAAVALSATGCESDTSSSLGTGSVGIVPGNATVTDLSISAGALNPNFSAATRAYTAAAPFSTTSTTVSATAPNGFNITVNGAAVANGSTSAPISLAVGDNTIVVVVSNANGSATGTYTITVTRAAF